MTSGEGTEVVDPPGAQSTSDILVRVEHVAKAFGPTQALQGLLVRAARGRGPRPGRRERLGQEHAGEDPQRGPPARRGPDRGRREPRLSCAAPRVVRSTASSPSSRRSSSPESRSVAGQRMARRRRHLAGAGPDPGEAAPCQGGPAGAPRPADRPVRGDGGALAQRPAGLLHRPRALLRNPRILILDEATSALDVATRDRLFALVSRLAADGVGVIFITHRLGRDRGDRRPHHGHALRVRRSPTSSARQWTPQRAGPAHDRLGCSWSKAGRIEEAHGRVPARGAPVLSVRGLRLRPGRRSRSTSRSRQESSSAWPASRATARTSSSRRCGGGTSDRGRGRPPPRRGAMSVVRSPVRRRATATSHTSRASGASTPLFSWMTIRENFALPTLGADSRFGWLSPRSSRTRGCASTSIGSGS